MPKITGAAQAKKRLADLSGAEKIEFIGQALFAAGQEIKAEAQFLITQGSVSGKNHVPSAPGTPPNNDTGHLKDQIRVEQPAPLRVLITSNAAYAAIHEFGGTINHPGGTPFFIKDDELIFVSLDSPFAARLPRTKPHLITIPERPYMGPAARNKRAEVVAKVNRAISLVTRR